MSREELCETFVIALEKSRITCDDNLAECEGKESEVFTFFRLPFELRILCYQYLVPNTVVPSYPVPSRFSSLDIPTEIRDDKQICTPGILGVSKQVHNETIDLFYGSGRFELTLVKRGGMTFDFLGSGYFFDDDNLPPVYYLVRHLKLTIKMKGLLNDVLREQISHIYRHCFMHEKHSALETLQIEFQAHHLFWGDHLGSLADILKAYVEPLKEIQGLRAVARLRGMGMSDEAKRGGTTESPSIGKQDQILEGVQNALDETKRWMLLPVPATIPDQKSSLEQQSQTMGTGIYKSLRSLWMEWQLILQKPNELG